MVVFIVTVFFLVFDPAANQVLTQIANGPYGNYALNGVTVAQMSGRVLALFSASIVAILFFVAAYLFVGPDATEYDSGSVLQ